MTIHELPPEEIAKLREKAKPVIAKYTKELGEEFVDGALCRDREGAGQEVIFPK